MGSYQHVQALLTRIKCQKPYVLPTLHLSVGLEDLCRSPPTKLFHILHFFTNSWHTRPSHDTSPHHPYLSSQANPTQHEPAAQVRQPGFFPTLGFETSCDDRGSGTGQ